MNEPCASSKNIPNSGPHNWRVLNGTQYVRHLKSSPSAPKKRVRMKSMAATVTTSFPIPVPAREFVASSLVPNRQRRVTPRAGHALEKLGHAIEYLTDEFVHQGGSLSSSDAQLQAVQLLMALNRAVYFECPEAPTFSERCRSFLRINRP
jgi:hypothetical protein